MGSPSIIRKPQVKKPLSQDAGWLEFLRQNPDCLAHCQGLQQSTTRRGIRA